jgi:O-6-methylguanine DNA methyltransferase
MEYFNGQRQDFDVPVTLEGTAFQQDIWQALLDIPYGHTLSYGELGAAAGHPGSARAVGGAVGANPIPIIVPCHRVMGANGAITGYSGGSGIATKQWLIEKERSA